MLDRATELAATWGDRPTSKCRVLLRRLLSGITVYADRLDLHLHLNRLAALLSGAADPDVDQDREAKPSLILSAPVKLLRSKLEMAAGGGSIHSCGP